MSLQHPAAMKNEMAVVSARKFSVEETESSMRVLVGNLLVWQPTLPVFRVLTILEMILLYVVTPRQVSCTVLKASTFPTPTTLPFHGASVVVR